VLGNDQRSSALDWHPSYSTNGVGHPDGSFGVRRRRLDVCRRVVNGSAATIRKRTLAQRSCGISKWRCWKARPRFHGHSLCREPAWRSQVRLSTMASQPFAPREEVILAAGSDHIELDPSAARRAAGGVASAQAARHVTVERYAPLGLTLRVTSPGPSFLVVSDTFCPGWHAYI
jgi:hypothetical protein